MMSALPVLTPVTTPAIVTVATPVKVDCHVACDVTDCVEPFDNVAVAENCAVLPTTGAVPLTLTAVTTGVDEEGAVAAG